MWVTIQKEVKKRQSKTNPDYIKAKSLAVKAKLENPNLTVREIEEKYWISRQVASSEIRDKLSDIADKNKNIIQDNIKIMEAGQKKILEAIPNLDLSRASDVNYLADALKSAQSVNSMILKYSDNPNDNTKVIPVNINIQYNDNRNTKPTN